MSIITSLLGDFWPYIAGAVAFVAGIVATYLKGRRDANMKRRAQDAERRVKTIKEVAEHAKDAEEQTDQELVDRLTRRP